MEGIPHQRVRNELLENGAGTLIPSWCDPEFDPTLLTRVRGCSLLGTSRGQQHREGWLLHGSNVHLPFTVERRENDRKETDHGQLSCHLITALKTDMSWQLGSPRELSGKWHTPNAS